MSKSPMFLRPSARLQKYLGRELISDPNLAVLEFVKNAYDAGAAAVRVEFFLLESPSRLLITDDGTGMDESEFRENWLRPGFSQKSPDAPIKQRANGAVINGRTANAEAQRRSMAREPAGEKGLGRLSAGRLGDVLEVWTRKADNEDWLHVTFDWGRFDDMSIAMDEVTIPFDYKTPLPAGLSATSIGTIVQISGLRQRWAGMVPGRAQAGRRRTRLGRLYQDLQFLLRGMPSDPDLGIEITLESDSVRDHRDVGVIRPGEARYDSADYVYEFYVYLDRADYVTIERHLTRSTRIAESVEKPQFEVLGPVTVTDKIAKAEDRPPTLACGPFSGQFLYTPPPAARRASQVDAANSGVLVYRDNVLVEPYGLPGDDWLGAEARKASRQGHAAIQPSNFSGTVRISRTENPDLEDMSNRLGLLDNEAFYDFLEHAQAEFDFFEKIIYAEVLQERWRTKGQQASAAAALRGEELTQMRLRSLAHRAGQPLQTLAFDVLRIEGVVKSSGLPERAQAILSEAVVSMQISVERVAGIIRDVADLRLPEFEEIPLRLLLEEALQEADDPLKGSDVHVEVERVVSTSVVVPGDLVVGALAELLVNAAEALDGQDDAVIRVWSAESTAGAVDLYVEDNGPGISGWRSGLPLDAIESTKGRPPGGLVGAASEVTASNGYMEIQRSDSDGTRVLVRLPYGISPVRR